MKNTLLLVISFFVIINLTAQTDHQHGYDYLSEFSDTNMLHRDVFLFNADDGQWPAVGTNQTSISVSYSHDIMFGKNLKMIVYNRKISAIEYSEFFIFDAAQNLTHYIYQSDNTEIIFVYENNKFSILRQTAMSEISNNYFISDPDTMFNPDQILLRSNEMLKHCAYTSKIPIYSEEIDKINNYINLTKKAKKLKVKKIDKIEFYSKNDTIVKIIDKTENLKEYYFENDKIIFSYFEKFENKQNLKLYFTTDNSTISRNQPFIIMNNDSFINQDDNIYLDFLMIVYDNIEKLMSLLED